MIRDVMDVYLVEMELEGFVKEAKDRWMGLPSTTNHSCVGAGGDDSGTESLGLVRFEGIFEILAVVIVVSLAWNFIATRLATRDPKAPGDPQEVEASIGQVDDTAAADGEASVVNAGAADKAQAATVTEPSGAKMEAAVAALDARMTQLQSGIDKVREHGRGS